MKLKEISKPQTTASLNESLAKTFGQRINVDAFTLEQLQDARNKIRTELSQIETNESFDSVLKDSDYQKKKGPVKEGDGIYHDCAKSFKHPKLGECECIPGQHTLLEDGTVTHYDVKF